MPTVTSNLTYTTYVVVNKFIIIIVDLTPTVRYIYPITNFEFGLNKKKIQMAFFIMYCATNMQIFMKLK